MAESPTLETWSRLYTAAKRVKELSPWDWLEEHHIFGVRNPEKDEIGFVSVMGALGDHFGISIYLGAEGLYGFWMLEELGPMMNPESLFEIPQLQASFEDREVLDKADREVIKALKLKFRGRSTWPFFRSFRPGYFPWFLEEDEARFLACALEQCAEVSARFKTNPDALTDQFHKHTCLVRVPDPNSPADSPVWRDEMVHVPEPPRKKVAAKYDEAKFAAYKQLGKSSAVLELDCFMNASTPIKEPGDERPYFPHMLMVVDSKDGRPIGVDLIAPKPDMHAVWGQIPDKLLDMFLAAQIRPRQIKVALTEIVDALAPLSRKGAFKVKLVDDLPQLDLFQMALSLNLENLPDLDESDDFPFDSDEMDEDLLRSMFPFLSLDGDDNNH
jgi:hypothetical protein